MSTKTLQIAAFVVSVMILGIMAYGFFQDRQSDDDSTGTSTAA